MKARLLWIEGKRADSPPFVPSLRKKGYVIETATTGAEALARLNGSDPDLVVVNSASMRSNGRRICRSIREKVANMPILVITSQEYPLQGETCANVVLELPFTLRKLINRINPLLPGQGNNLLHTGPIRLDLERQQVHCQGREARLTPRLTLLLQILMDHPGEVLERDRLFRDVWKTGYTGDTRTLDVHISWLRQAIEADPRNPVYLKTVRGVGYRLDV